jgi:AraC-like DNA-binding protein
MGYFSHVLRFENPKTRRLLSRMAGLLVLAGALLWGFSQVRRETHIPSWQPDAFDDRQSGGSSQVLSVGPIPGGWRLVCQLGDQPVSYCGMALSIPPTESTIVDLRDLSDLELTVRNTAGGSAKVVLTAHDPVVTRPAIPLSYRYSEARLESNQGRITIPVGDFKLATWWLDLGMVSPKETDLRLDRFHGIGLQVNAQGRGAPDTLDLLDLRLLTRPRTPWLPIALLWSLAVVAGLVILVSRRLAPPQEPAPSLQDVPSPTPLALKSSTDEARDRLVAWLREHYMESDLDADAVTRGTGIAKDKLASLLRESFGMPFKPFLNELRLTEATRLLRETDRSISEIAFAVGYNTHTHFSRIFRDRYGCSPVEWREREPQAAPETSPPN